MSLPSLLRVSLPVLILLGCCNPPSALAVDRVTIDLSGPGWKLWPDRAAKWEDDPLHFPAPPIDTLPVNTPTGGWDALAGREAVPVSVPGTVEEYLQTKPGPDGDLRGVSWWTRTLTLPAVPSPRTVLLRFESVRQRAEVFVNRRLASYDVVGNTPFEADITRFVRLGEPCEIAVRVTDPGGNFDWRDSQALRWGEYALPMSHGFGGVTGGVQVIVADPVHIEDIYVQNLPAVTAANVIATLRNTTGTTVRRNLRIDVLPRGESGEAVFSTRVEGIELAPGANPITSRISAPRAPTWDLEHPHLHVCRVSLEADDRTTDADERTFGFRWFNVDGVGTDAVLRLNGRRIVLRTAISWGFWPVNGMFPTPELAARQVRVAREMGLNMLNFHRAIGHPIVLDEADRQGLLYYAEPGAYKSVTRDAFGRQLAREKLLRMVRRDRSHPSLVIYNLINEWDSRNPNPDRQEIARHQADLAAAHQLDPSRLITHTSAWSRGKDIDDPAKLHFRPFDDRPYWNGWYDVHHAGGPATWHEGMYQSPTAFYLHTDNVREIVFWGEEGALSTPPRLGAIKTALEAGGRLGWDGGMYLDWFRTFDRFMRDKGLDRAFPTVDALTTAMGAVSLGHQGRRIENIRIGNVTDGYAVNGWEAEIIENHSGIVDCFRNPKGDPAILAYYNQPLYVAVKLRTTVVHAPASLVADFFLVNERDVRGPHQLEVAVRDGSGRLLTQTKRPVVVTGGERYGELLVPDVSLDLPAGARGKLQVAARLVDGNGIERARGRDEAFALDWRNEVIRGAGAVWETEARIQKFLTGSTRTLAPAYSRAMPRLDWIAVAHGPGEGEPTPIPGSRFTLPGRAVSGLQTAFFHDFSMKSPAHERVDAVISFSVDDGAAPDPALGVMTNYAVRWAGELTAERTGAHAFVVRSSGGVRLIVDGKTMIDEPPPRNARTVRASMDLVAEKPVSIVLEFRQARGNAHCQLSWITPEEDPAIGPSILERVARDGTTLVVLERAEAWMPLVTGTANPAVKYNGAFKVGKTWLGGVHFVKEHPLFSGLPTNDAMDWPYQAVVRNGDDRTGLQLEGEEFAAGCYHSYPMQLGTVVGVIPFGKGRIVFSTLDICSQLNAPTGPADVARKLLVNYLGYVNTR